MFKYLKSILITTLLLFPLSALAATEVAWKNAMTDAALDYTRPNNTTANVLSLDLTQTVSPGSIVYVSETGTGVAQNNYSKILNISGCGTFTLIFFPNRDSITADGAIGNVYYCSQGISDPDGDGSTSGCYKLTADIDSTSEGIDNYSFTGDPGNAGTDYDGLGATNQAWMDDIHHPLIYVIWSTDPGNGVTSDFVGFCQK